MDDLQNMVDLGDRIMSQVAHAIESNNYSGLADGIRDQVNDYAEDVARTRGQNAGPNRAPGGQNAGVNWVPGGQNAGVNWVPGGQNAGVNWVPGGQNAGPNWVPGGQNAGPNRAPGGQQAAGRRPQDQGQPSPGARPFPNYGPQAGAGMNGRPGMNARNTAGSWNQRSVQEEIRRTVNQGTEAAKAVGSAAVDGFRAAWNNGGTPFLMTRPVRTKHTLKTVFGTIGAILFFPVAISFLQPLAIAEALVSGALGAVSVAGIVSGIRGRKLVQQYYRYGSLAGNREYVDIRQLANAAGETPEKAVKDLDRMIQQNYLPRARFDDQKTTLLLTDGAYSQYQTVKQHQQAVAREEAERAASEAGMDPESRKILEEGERFVREIRKANDDIPGEVMSEKLDRLELIVGRIFARVRENPKSAPALRRFMSYYVPTIRKLMNAYIELDRQPEAGANIASTKKEIEGAIDEVNRACEVLLDSLFQDDAWDISSDISVMKNMMAQDGLTGDGGRSAGTTGK